MLLKENVEDVSILVYRPPQPVGDPSDPHVHFIQMSPRTPSGFSVTQFLSQERSKSKFDVPLPQGLVADHAPALMEEFLHVTLTEREPMVEPQGVADDAQGKSMTVRLLAAHSSACRG